MSLIVSVVAPAQPGRKHHVPASAVAVDKGKQINIRIARGKEQETASHRLRVFVGVETREESQEMII